MLILQFPFLSTLFKFKYNSFKINRMAILFHIQIQHQSNTNENAHFTSSTDDFVHLLHICTNPKMLKQVHARMLITGLEQDIFLGAKLLNMYAKYDSIKNAGLVFYQIEYPDVYLCNLMIKVYTQNGLWKEILSLYKKMQSVGIKPDNFTFPFVLKACASLSALQEGREVHDDIVESDFESHVVVGTALINMYAKCGSLQDAREVFDKMFVRDVFSWSAIIAGYAQNGYAKEALMLFEEMQAVEGMSPDSVVMVSVLQACGDVGDLQQGMLAHDYVVRHGFELDVEVGNSLIAMYAKCRRMESSLQVFKSVPQKSVVSWTAMIAGYGWNLQGIEALEIYNQMRLSGVKPNSMTMTSMLSVCAELRLLQLGKLIHDYVVGHGLVSNEFVANSLIDMYAKCLSLKDARLVFDKIPQRSLVSWNTIIAGYVQNGHPTQALVMFNEMQLAGMMPDSFTIVSVLSACAHVVDLQQGKSIHDFIIRTGLESNVFVANSLIDMYAKCKNQDIARKMFDRMCTRDVVSWNAMISGYAQNGYANEALELFAEMQLGDVKPDAETMVSLLLACSNLGALQQGMWIHTYVIRRGLEFDVFVERALIDMYAKCGNVDVSRQLFDNISKKTAVAYSAMIAGYGMHGRGEDALVLFSQMQQKGLKPNGITFISVLSACSHSGLVDEGWRQFNCMSKDYNISPMLQHCACMVDLLGRAGRIYEAHDFIQKMPVTPNADVWGTLLGACKIHCNTVVGEHVAEILLDLEPKNAGYYVLLSNLYAANGRWDEVAKVRTKMKDRGLKKTSGWSSIQISNRFHSFHSGDKSHPESIKIYAMLDTLTRQMKDAGYMPNTNLLLHDIE
ncbi:putative pentatricopeptide repeat-containing protein At3g01580 [Cryptomeria japonica]|uniref:putative pentatricopeptide repeat-containing protein At3g01580 n=1 Tax=Cryptomeria japonica TaxID=3369 RepID=UPI0027DA623E|nr:putative pentatricopeptide repeat-containing protein At3g01580 [Cryptomeria japonica]